MVGNGEDGGKSRNAVFKFLLWECWTDGSILTLKKDVISGITLAVTQVAPSIAFALMAGGPPLAGLFSSFFLGFISCVFGGRPGQITAIAGCVVVLYPDLVKKHGYDFVCVVSIISGLLHFVLSLLRFARYVTLLPASVMVGFCNGLAVSMVTHQISSFKDAEGNYPVGLDAVYVSILCILTYCIMMLMPLFTTFLPSTFVAIIIGTGIDYICRMKTTTIGDLYDLKGDFPSPKLPDVPWSSGEFWKDVSQCSVLSFITAAVESFLGDYKIQQMTETPTNFDREAWAIGASLVVNGFFQGIPGCVVFGPSVLNIESGTGTRRMSSCICAILMAVIPLALYPIIRLIPMAVLSAVVLGVSSKTADWRMLAMIFLQRISFQEAAVCLVVTVVTLITNLAVATGCGFVVALLCFMWNMSRGRFTIIPHTDLMISLEDPPPDLHLSTSAPPDIIEDAAQATARHSHHVSFVLPDEPIISPAGRESGDEMDEVQPSDDNRSKWLPEDSIFSETEHDERASPESECIRLENSNSFPRTGGSLSSSFHIGVPNTSMVGKNFLLDIDFLNIEEDSVFPQIKVLRVKLCGVLFFGSCTDFVENMMKMLHLYHSQLFLRVTDFIFDFQGGLMPVMDYSAAEALEMTAQTLAKRGIRIHLQNMDPESFICVERARRYFPHVSDDNVDNVKNVCYARRVFNRGEVSHWQNSGEDILDNNVFTTAGPNVEPGGTTAVLRATDEVLSFKDTIKVGFPLYREQFDITVPVFDTLIGWKERIRNEGELPTSQLNKGITTQDPFDRRFGEFSKVWWRRIRNIDLTEIKSANNCSRALESSPRPIPTLFLQVPRFPGQGYSKKEEFTAAEWATVERCVLELFGVDDTRQALGCFSLKMLSATNALIDGFV